MSKVLQGSNLEAETKDGRFPIKWDPDQQNYYIVSSDGPQKAAPSQDDSAMRFAPGFLVMNGCLNGTCRVLQSTGKLADVKWGPDPESVENPTLAVDIYGKRSRIQWNAEKGAYFLVNPDDTAVGSTQQETGNTALADAISMGFMDKVGKKPV